VGYFSYITLPRKVKDLNERFRKLPNDRHGGLVSIIAQYRLKSKAGRAIQVLDRHG
jgi:hypothetical protein